MQSILTVTIPFFALVFLGYLAAQQHLLSESAIPGLNAYVLYFALPCLLFRFGSSMPLARLIDDRLLAGRRDRAGVGQDEQWAGKDHRDGDVIVDPDSVADRDQRSEHECRGRRQCLRLPEADIDPRLWRWAQ